MGRWLNRNLPADRRIELRIGWPLWLIPLMLINQLVAPHIVWVVFLVALAGFYVVSYLWVRSQAPAVMLTRRRIGAILVAGDLLQEEFELKNDSMLPLLWAEFIDESTVPEYRVGRVVACEGQSFARWRAEVLCKRRGLFRLGPHLLRFQDPLGLFVVTAVNPHEEIVVIYPRVVHLPHLQLPRGNAQGADRQRRPLLGNLPAATVTEYQPGDSLRHVHWASTARHGRMMVKELEIEPSGNIWLVLDLNRHVQRGEGPTGTLEHSIVVTASLAADLLSGRDQRAVGLLAFGGSGGGDGGLVQVAPGVGSAHLWPILTALAPVAAGELSLAALLASSRDRVGRRSTLTVITPVGAGGSINPPGVGAEADIDWVAELVHLRGVGVDSSVVLIAEADANPSEAERVQALLARLNIPCSLVVAGAPLPALLTFHRRRRVVRTTPTGGVVSYEVDEEVG
ncbi:MAG: DUF58 domain-containing protein [Caldilineaceae bacterium]|nr:DUF58 domain-containing protein [Caldilineaceae bacterium]